MVMANMPTEGDEVTRAGTQGSTGDVEAQRRKFNLV